MIQLRRSAERGHANHGWLESYHTFSFADYQDAKHVSFRNLRVINEDRVQPAKGFGTHSHRDMEIITWVLDGALAHKDSLGTSSEIRPGELQRMSAGTGVTHSEFNASPTQLVHFLQIWILPERAAMPPSYEQRAFPAGERRDHLALLASHDGREGSVTVHQDVSLFVGDLTPGAQVEHRLAPGRHAWLHVARGRVRLGTDTLEAGDAAAVSAEAAVRVEALDASEVLIFDLA